MGKDKNFYVCSTKSLRKEEKPMLRVHPGVLGNKMFFFQKPFMVLHVFHIILSEMIIYN